jgi:hypothetical protein
VKTASFFLIALALLIGCGGQVQTITYQPPTATPTPTLTSTPMPPTGLLPDLVIYAEITMRGYTGGCVTEYAPLMIKVCVENQGGAAAGPFVVRYMVQIRREEYWQIEGLAAGEERCLESNAPHGWTEVTVDVGDVVVESDETNNTQGVPVPTPPPICTPTHTPSPISLINCPVLPAGGFLKIWQSNPDLQAELGCPTSYHPRITPTAWEVTTSYQPFERGEMIWSDRIGWYHQPVVYVLYADSTYQRFDDTFDPAVDPISGGEMPPNGLVEPILGFGKVWREMPGVRDALGWATAGETPGVGRFQMFCGGNMVWISQTNQTYVFFIGGIVHVFDVPFSEL